MEIVPESIDETPVRIKRSMIAATIVTAAFAVLGVASLQGDGSTNRGTILREGSKAAMLGEGRMIGHNTAHGGAGNNKGSIRGAAKPGSAAAKKQQQQQQQHKALKKELDFEKDSEVPQWMMDKVCDSLHRYEGFAFDEETKEIIGEVARVEWKRRHLERASRVRDGSGEPEPGLGSMRLGNDGETLTTPIYVMSLGASKTSAVNNVIGHSDSERVARLVKELARAHGTEAVKSHVRLTPGVNVKDWPEKENVVQFALKEIMKLKDSEKPFASLPWIGMFASRDSHGRFNDKFASERHLEHHIGCLFGHLFQFQLAYESGNKDAYMLESDAWDPALLGVPFSAYDALVKNAPENYDIIFTNNPGALDLPSEPVHQFKDPVTDEMINIYRFKNHNGEAGLSQALYSERSYPKIFKHVARSGGDMIDAMLKVQLCTDNDEDEKGIFTGFNQGNEPLLRCYWALPASAGKLGKSGDTIRFAQSESL